MMIIWLWSLLLFDSSYLRVVVVHGSWFARFSRYSVDPLSLTIAQRQRQQVQPVPLPVGLSQSVTTTTTSFVFDADM